MVDLNNVSQTAVFDGMMVKLITQGIMRESLFFHQILFLTMLYLRPMKTLACPPLLKTSLDGSMKPSISFRLKLQTNLLRDLHRTQVDQQHETFCEHLGLALYPTTVESTLIAWKVLSKSCYRPSSSKFAEAYPLRQHSFRKSCTENKMNFWAT